MNFHDLATNPAGKGSAQIANRGMVISYLKDKARTRGAIDGIDMTVYKDGGRYLLYFRLLSEHWRDLWYDTVITLTPPKGLDANAERTVAEYTVNFVSNMPSFAYTYLYVCFKNGDFLTSFKKKFPDIFFTEAPKVRNPSMTMGFEKAILLPVFFMTLKRFQYKDALDKLSKGRPNMLVLFKKFMNFEDKMKEYEKLMKAHKEAQRKTGVKLRKTKNGYRIHAIKPKAPKASKKAESAVSKKRSSQPSTKVYSSRDNK